ncbi:MAG: hypothetical protein JO271_04280 [Verrucomicrobia bacterium]|nr:hypothetical protein [Verrucomicrobiota bacterium]
MFTLTCYVQLREQFRSSMTPFLETGRESVPEQDRDQAVGSQASSRHPMEAPNSLAPKDTNPGELVNLEDAFLAITEELNFDFPEPSRVDRIKAGLIEVTIRLAPFRWFTSHRVFLQDRVFFKP